MKYATDHRQGWLPATVACCLLACVGCAKEAPPARSRRCARSKIFEVGSPDATLVSQREYPGHITASKEAEVSFEVSGRVLELPVVPSQRVKKGELLARLDPSDYQARLLMLARPSAMLPLPITVALKSFY